MSHHLQRSLTSARGRRGYLVIAALALVAIVTAAPICGSPTPQATPVPSTPTAVIVQPATLPDTATAAAAATATATPAAPAATPAHTFGLPEAANFPSPTSQSDSMIVGGGLWVDGKSVVGDVIAYVGGKECGRGRSLRLPDGGLPDFVLRIASDAEQPGCGIPGALVTITANGRAMDDAVVWQPGFQQPREFFAGPVVAQYSGQIRFDKSFIPARVVPYVGDVVCGRQVGPLQGDGEIGYQIVVDPAELRAGCGRDDALITLRMEGDAPGGTVDIVVDTIPWQPGSPVRRAMVDLSTQIAATTVAGQ